MVAAEVVEPQAGYPISNQSLCQSGREAAVRAAFCNAKRIRSHKRNFISAVGVTSIGVVWRANEQNRARLRCHKKMRRFERLKRWISMKLC